MIEIVSSVEVNLEHFQLGDDESAFASEESLLISILRAGEAITQIKTTSEATGTCVLLIHLQRIHGILTEPGS